MRFKRFLRMMVTDPNSSEGLVIRAEKLEEGAERLDGEIRDRRLLYARVLRELALKNFSPAQNKAFIRENMRQGR